MADILLFVSGSADPHSFKDPDPGSQNLADPTDQDPDPDSKYWLHSNLGSLLIIEKNNRKLKTTAPGLTPLDFEL